MKQISTERLIQILKEDREQRYEEAVLSWAKTEKLLDRCMAVDQGKEAAKSRMIETS